MHTLGRCGLEVSALGLGCNNFGARLDEKGSNAVAEHVARARGGNRPVANQCDWRPPPARAGGFQAPLRDGPGGSRYVGRSACWIGAKEEKEEMDVVRHRLEGDDNPPAAPRSATRSFSRVSTSLASGLPTGKHRRGARGGGHEAGQQRVARQLGDDSRLRRGGPAGGDRRAVRRDPARPGGGLARRAADGPERARRGDEARAGDGEPPPPAAFEPARRR